MTDFLKDQYDNQCPDCGSSVDKDTQHEQACEHCGHVFFDPGQTDNATLSDTY